MLDIDISIMFVQFIPLIFIPITYYFYFNIFFSSFPKGNKQSSKGTDHNIVHCGLINFIHQCTTFYSVRVAQYFEKKVICIANIIVMVGFISLSFLLLIIGFLRFHFLSAQKTRQHIMVTIIHIKCER